MKKKVINNVLPVTTTKCVYMDGTSTTLDEYLSNNLSSPSKYNNKNFLWLGDSISSGSGGYPSLVSSNFNATLTNLSSSGGDTNRMRNICQGLNGYTKPNYNDIDYVFIMIGHNCDNFPKEDIGMIPVDSTGFADYPNNNYANIASCIEFIWNEKHSIEIFLITPIQSTNGRYAPTTLKAHSALKEIGIMYSIPVIDIYAISGICRRNISIYTSDNIHPNDSGKNKIAKKIISQMLSY